MLELLLSPPSFLIYALLGGLGIAFISAPLGVFMVWQRQSYFGATLAHSALLGVGLGVFFQLNITLSIVGVSVLMALSIYSLQRRLQLSSDTLLGLLAHSTLALGLVILSLQKQVQVDFMSLLFGDILSIEQNDLWLIGGLALVVGVFFLNYWQDLLNVTLNPELAAVEGTPVQRVQLAYIMLLALMIALAMKMVGVLLVTSLLIIPAAAARRLANTPLKMLLMSWLIGLLSVVIGLITSATFDISTGPAIVLTASVFFLVSLIKAKH
ncbi:metal ABC transporter permease [Thiosulfativibrio zosterae]|uniref:High-affinity zinc uptake system membrane protein ZnuB n=1 Tax=Thiosulfativibrio zosterae TaxID=2675053 RepID=A0A6F8PLP9_9GAMM|nr:iron chelate uptake ABC transporter family permease subunit [Thiosulfativibrio zosterae]BBP42920.1 membrane protein [Thiosulfativibrio zosterae]